MFAPLVPIASRWCQRAGVVLLGMWILIGITRHRLAQAEEPAQRAIATTELPPPQSAEEARGRARLLFELANGSLQVMHRDFFDDENPRAIPSASLEDVFVELEKSYGVRMRWLNAGTDMVNFDHQPQDAFDAKAVEAIKRGELRFDEASDTEYRFAGAIRLASQCLKCHVKGRTSNEDQFAGLTIKMEFQQPSSQTQQQD